MEDLDYTNDELDNIGTDANESENDSKNWRRKLEQDAKDGHDGSHERSLFQQGGR